MPKIYFFLIDDVTKSNIFTKRDNTIPKSSKFIEAFHIKVAEDFHQRENYFSKK